MSTKASATNLEAPLHAQPSAIPEHDMDQIPVTTSIHRAQPLARQTTPTISVAARNAARTALEEPRYGVYVITGLLLLILGFGGFGTWAALAPLTTGAMALGTVHLEGERKTVQHLEGGIVKEILVKEGDEVEAGQVLIRLDGTLAKANLAALSADYYSLLAQGGRLQAEKRLADKVVFPGALFEQIKDPEINELVSGEAALFEVRKTSLNDQLNILAATAQEHEDEIKGLISQRQATQTQLIHIRDELDAVDILYKKGLIDKPRLLALKRTAAGLEGKVGELDATISRVRQQIGETKLRAVAVRTKRLEEVSAQLQQVHARTLQVLEKLTASRDSVARLDVQAPRAGRVVDLKVHTTGGVITPSLPILDIVPKDDRLIVLAQINPLDIDVVAPGLEAQVQLSAYSMRSTPPLPGRVLQVSADRMQDKTTGLAYYIARVEVDADALNRLEGVELYPGMPASVQIVTGTRTPMDYLLAPLQAGLRNAWLEN